MKIGDKGMKRFSSLYVARDLEFKTIMRSRYTLIIVPTPPKLTISHVDGDV